MWAAVWFWIFSRIACSHYNWLRMVTILAIYMLLSKKNKTSMNDLLEELVIRQFQWHSHVTIEKVQLMSQIYQFEMFLKGRIMGLMESGKSKLLKSVSVPQCSSLWKRLKAPGEENPWQIVWDSLNTWRLMSGIDWILTII